MISRVLILTFLLSVAADSLAAVAPHIDGEGCSARCCQAARQNRSGTNPSKLRCLMDCNQSGAASTYSPTASLNDQRHAKIGADLCSGASEAAPLGATMAFRF